MTLESPSAPDDGVRALVDAALAEARTQRGGAELLGALDLGEDPAADLCVRGALRVRRDDGDVTGIAVVVSGVLAAVYVAPDRRRQGRGRAIVAAVRSEPGAPRDAWALPGDRATKSLYESIGMKARLLTMRAE
ncbi:MAG TPA: GNAT family N-acetyltransferase [Acidimicrobiales bacterium]|nr:GNAT family N-acetyltransferase [Acidimicrobiales bacterium]